MIKNINYIQNKIDYEKTYYYLMIFFAFSLPLSRAVISFIVIVLPIIWIVEGDLKRKYNQIKENRILVVLFVFILFSCISIIWSENNSDALKMIRLNLYLFSIFVIVTSLSKDKVQIIIKSFLCGMFVSEIIAYGVFFEFFELEGVSAINPSPFMIHIEYSVFLAFTSILLLNRIFSKNYTFNEKLFFLFFFLTVTGNLFLTFGRTGQVAFIFAIIIMPIIHFRLSLKSILISIILLFTIFFTAFNISKAFETRVNHTVTDINKIMDGDLSGSWGIRTAYWVLTYNIIKEHPLGRGIGDFENSIREEQKKEKYSFLSHETKKFLGTNHPHNQYLLILLQTGIVGLLIFIYFIYKVFTLKIQDKDIKETSILFFVVFLVSCMAEPLLIKQFSIALFIFFLSLILISKEDSLARS